MSFVITSFFSKYVYIAVLLEVQKCHADKEKATNTHHYFK